MKRLFGPKPPAPDDGKDAVARRQSEVERRLELLRAEARVRSTR